MIAFPVQNNVCHAILVSENNESYKTITCGIFNVVDSYCFNVDIKGEDPSEIPLTSFTELNISLHFSYDVLSCYFSTKTEIKKC